MIESTPDYVQNFLSCYDNGRLAEFMTSTNHCIAEPYDCDRDIFVKHDMKVIARNELRRRNIIAFRHQHDAPLESEWDDELRMMFAIQFPAMD